MSTKQAADVNPASPTASTIVPTKPATGLMGKGSRLGGMAPRQSFAPVNTTAPPAPAAGALEQKSIAPPSPMVPAPPPPPAPMVKMNSAKGNEVDMTTMGVRPLRLQDMLKTAMAQTAEKVSVSAEAARQMDVPAEKTAEKNNSGAVDYEYAMKLAGAIEVIAEQIGQEKEADGMGGPYALHENKIEAGKGPGALHVMQAESSERFPAHQGQGHHTVPMHPGAEKGLASEHGATKLETNMDSPAGFHGTQTTAMSGGKGKTAAEKCEKCGKSPCECKVKSAAARIKSAFSSLRKVAGEDEKLEKRESEGMAEAAKGLAKAEAAHAQEDKGEKKEGSSGSALVDYMLAKTKIAEDAINPAHISAGPAVPPDASASGESGGNPAGGAPQGPRGLVGSNESAMNYKRNQAYAGRKSELKEYFNEPALSGATDSTLNAAFAHTPQAGTKFASMGVTGGTKVAAARAVLSKLAEEAEAKKSVKDKGEKKEKDSNLGC